TSKLPIYGIYITSSLVQECRVFDIYEHYPQVGAWALIRHDNNTAGKLARTRILQFFSQVAKRRIGLLPGMSTAEMVTVASCFYLELLLNSSGLKKNKDIDESPRTHLRRTVSVITGHCFLNARRLGLSYYDFCRSCQEKSVLYLFCAALRVFVLDFYRKGFSMVCLNYPESVWVLSSSP
ncbi:hypothetical protein EVAR_67970_1, partial [Eumeta japonica]